MTRVFDVSDPHNAKEVYTKKIGDQVNMLSQSWDGKRVYFTSSLLANWDKAVNPEIEPGNTQYFKAFDHVNGELVHRFTIDFGAEKLGMPHQMRFGAYSLYAKTPNVDGGKKLAELSQ